MNYEMSLVHAWEMWKLNKLGCCIVIITVKRMWKVKDVNILSDVNENKTGVPIRKSNIEMHKRFFVYLVNNMYCNFGNQKYFHLKHLNKLLKQPKHLKKLFKKTKC